MGHNDLIRNVGHAVLASTAKKGCIRSSDSTGPASIITYWNGNQVATQSNAGPKFCTIAVQTGQPFTSEV